MPSNPLDDVLFSAVAARARAQNASDTQTVLICEVVETIIEDVDDGKFTSTIAEGSATPGDVQWVVEALRQAGYGVSLSTTNIVVTW